MKTHDRCTTCHRKVLVGVVECVSCGMARRYGPTPRTITAAPVIRDTTYPPCPRKKGR